MGHSGWKGRLLGWRVLDFNFFGINQWVGTSLAAWRQILTFVANFGRFRAKKWPNSTFLRTDFESFGFSYFFCIFDPTQGQYGWKHYALCAGWLDLAQKCAKLPNLAKTLKSQPDPFKIENSAYFSVSASYANFGVFGPWSRVAHFWAFPWLEIKLWTHF